MHGEIGFCITTKGKGGEQDIDTYCDYYICGDGSVRFDNFFMRNFKGEMKKVDDRTILNLIDGYSHRGKIYAPSYDDLIDLAYQHRLGYRVVKKSEVENDD